MELRPALAGELAPVAVRCRCELSAVVQICLSHLQKCHPPPPHPPPQHPPTNETRSHVCTGFVLGREVCRLGPQRYALPQSTGCTARGPTRRFGTPAGGNTTPQHTSSAPAAQAEEVLHESNNEMQRCGHLVQAVVRTPPPPCTPGVVKQDKSSGGSVGVRMSSG